MYLGDYGELANHYTHQNHLMGDRSNLAPTTTSGLDDQQTNGESERERGVLHSLLY